MDLTGYLVIDTEVNGALRNKGHPFDPRNEMVSIGFRDGNGSTSLFRTYNNEFAGIDAIDRLGQCAYGEGLLLVGFNIKYDLHILRRYGFPIRQGLKIWDCQLAEFLLENQTNPYPSLARACSEHGLPLKKDILAHYIESGVDVHEIPEQELTEYLEGDLISTEALFQIQIRLIQDSGKWNLFRLQCQDLLVLADMEWNGMLYDLKKSEDLARISREKEAELLETLNLVVPSPHPKATINWNSGDQLSAILYGGGILFEWKEFVGVYKTGEKAGKARYKWLRYYHEFPRLVEPLKGSELKKEGFFSTDEGTLKTLKAKGVAKQIINLTLKLSEYDKLRGTYYEGIPKRFDEYNWQGGLVHGQINQVVAVTGRTNSLKPNLQNNPPESKECFISRYVD